MRILSILSVRSILLFRITLTVGKLPTPSSDLGKKPAHLSADFQPNAATTEYNLARRLIELPAQRLHLVPMPARIQGLERKRPAHIVRQHPDTKKYGVGLKLPAGHPLHAKADLQLLDPVLTALPALIVPLDHLLKALGTVGGRSPCISPLLTAHQTNPPAPAGESPPSRNACLVLFMQCTVSAMCPFW